MIKLLSASVVPAGTETFSFHPVDDNIQKLQRPVRILEGGLARDIIKVGNIIRNKDRFVKCLQHILEPGGSTLKAIELLTQCYILVQSL